MGLTLCIIVSYFCVKVDKKVMTAAFLVNFQLQFRQVITKKPKRQGCQNRFFGLLFFFFILFSFLNDLILHFFRRFLIAVKGNRILAPGLGHGA